MSKTLITLDGPSGVGKTTIGKRLASELNLEFFSSGLLYRVIALHNEKTNSFNLNDFEIVSNDPVVCKVDGNVYEEENLYTPQINRKSSEIAQLSEIRMLVSNVLKFLFDNSNTGLVVEGRDMGSVVFKNANLKIYLDASETTRSERRIAQSGNKESVEDIRARDSRDINRNDRFIQYGLVAAEMAIEDAGLKNINENDKLRTGVSVGSGIGGLETIYEGSLTINNKEPKKLSPFFIPSSLVNLLSGQISIKYGFKGPNHSVVTACATGAHSIGDSGEMIKRGAADVMIAGGSEAAVCKLGIAGFCAARSLSTSFNDNPSEASRPWDKNRDGFVMGEGAGIVVLEEMEFAKKRGAHIYAELLGYGMSGDAHHITAPAEDGDGGYRAMKSALEMANIT